MLNVLVVLVVCVTGGMLLLPRVSRARLWRATITPLASIIGSGFLVIGPILHHAFGAFAPLVMMILCGSAWLFGAAIRHNIAVIGDAPDDPRGATERRIETLASWALAFAYVISVAYYLNLFGEFALSLTVMDDPQSARLLTSGVFLIILFVGWTQGFSALERMEQITVSLKLAIIAGLLVGLGWYAAGRIAVGAVEMVPTRLGGWSAVTLLFGLVVTVQGFETSRYLGETYDAATRVRSMRLAQALSALIYLVFVVFLALSFGADEVPLEETAIITMMGIVAPILSVLLVAAALSAQFSAAVADAGGSGGLMAELSGHRVKPRQAYAVLVAVGLILTWTSNVFEIISYASRAFAVYYALQSVLAALSGGRRAPLFAAMAVLGVLIALFGSAIE